MIGIDVPAEGPIGFNSTVGDYAYFPSPLADGMTGEAESEFPGEVAFNAVILPVPRITSLGATSGPTTGGTSVTITGTDFAEVKGVSFGAVAASYRVDSESQITATSPAAPAGPMSVTVTTLAGSASSAQTFTYVAPSTTAPPTSVPPTTAPVSPRALRRPARCRSPRASD